MINSDISTSQIRLNLTDGLIILLAGLSTLWLYVTFWSFNTEIGNAEILVVQVADKQAQEYSLRKDQIIDIKGSLGSSLIEIKQGKARFIHSQCRNQFCVFHGWLTTAEETTACLPNQVSIQLKSGSSQYDALNY